VLAAIGRAHGGLKDVGELGGERESAGGYALDRSNEHLGTGLLGHVAGRARR
jgi:hypothetical protein